MNLIETALLVDDRITNLKTYRVRDNNLDTPVLTALNDCLMIKKKFRQNKSDSQITAVRFDMNQ